MCETIRRLVKAVRRAEHVKVLGASLEGDFERFVRPARSLRGRFNPAAATRTSTSSPAGLERHAEHAWRCGRPSRATASSAPARWR